MLKTMLTYVLCLWYFVLFQVFPVVHFHRHDGGQLEACFTAAAYSQVDQRVHVDVHEKTSHARQHHNHAHRSETTCGHPHLTLPDDAQPEQCHPIYAAVDFDHFAKKSNTASRVNTLSLFAAANVDAYTFDLQHTCFIQDILPLDDLFRKIPSNKSPPRC